MKITLIVPRNYGENAVDVQGNFVNEEATGAAYVTSYLMSKGNELNYISSLEKKTIDNVVSETIDFQSEIVGLSIDTKLVPTAKKIIESLNKKNPDLIYILGGTHLLNSKIDDFSDLGIKPEKLFGVVGEGEETAAELVDTIKNNGDYSKVQGIVYKNKNGEIIIPPRRARIQNLDSLPYPYRNEEIKDKNAKGYFVYPSPNVQRGYAAVVGSRGCYYECKFCTNKSEWGGKIVYRNIENVISEMKFLKRKYDTNIIYFNDLNFTSNNKWVTELCKTLKKENLGIYWQALVNVSTSNNEEMLTLMKEAGCTRLLWGVETVDFTGKNAQKKFKTYQQTYDILKKAEDIGIINHGFLMIGLPEDTPDSIKNQMQSLVQLPLHSIRESVYVPFNGTEFAKETKILDWDYENWDGSKLVSKHPHLTIDKCQELRDYVIENFYNSPIYKKRINEFLNKNPHLKDSYENFLNENQEIKRFTEN